MLNDLIAAARARTARRTASHGRGFWLESEPLPKVLPGQGHDEVLPLVADGPGDGVTRELSPAELAERNARWQQAVDVAVGVPLRPRPGRPSTPDYGGELTGPTPLADGLRADRERLLAANGTLARRVRTLEAQLRAAGIEPVGRE